MEAEEGTTLEDVFLSVTAERGPTASESAPENTGDATTRQDEPIEEDGRIEDR
jgi:ABC-2 type transport system ATP-binding protein